MMFAACSSADANQGVIKSYDEQKGFGYIASSDFAALSGRDVYLTKEASNR